jgi:hypothetical protein
MNGVAAPLVLTSAVDRSKISGQVYALEGLFHGRDTPALTEWTSEPVWTEMRRGGAVSSITPS